MPYKQAFLWITLLLGAGCAAPAAHEGKDEKMLREICAEYWQGYLEAHPTEATSIGDRRYDHLLEDNSVEGRARELARIEEMLQRTRSISPEALSAADRLTRRCLIDVAVNDIARAACEFDRWVVDALRGPQVGFMNLVSIQTVSTPEEGRSMVARWRAMGPYMDRHIANLRRGQKEGKVATRVVIERTLGQLDGLLGSPAVAAGLGLQLRVCWASRKNRLAAS